MQKNPKVPAIGIRLDPLKLKKNAKVCHVRDFSDWLRNLSEDTRSFAPSSLNTV